RHRVDYEARLDGVVCHLLAIRIYELKRIGCSCGAGAHKVVVGSVIARDEDRGDGSAVDLLYYRPSSYPLRPQVRAHVKAYHPDIVHLVKTHPDSVTYEAALH